MGSALFGAQRLPDFLPCAMIPFVDSRLAARGWVYAEVLGHFG